jgi:RNA polymerase sigma-70 factor, ECF subfamily
VNAATRPVTLPMGAPESAAAPLGLKFRGVFEEHGPFVWRTLRGLGVPESGLDDAVQEVFLVVHAKLAEFEGRSALRTWICGIAYRVGANARRKAKRHTLVDVATVPLLAHDPTPEESVRVRDATRFVESFCATLEEGMRDVFVLCLLEERPAPEVGALLGVSTNTVSSRIHRLRESFRRELGKFEQIKEAP